MFSILGFDDGSVGIVPTHWINQNQNTTKYPPKSTTDSVLNNMILNLKPAKEDWKDFKITKFFFKHDSFNVCSTKLEEVLQQESECTSAMDSDNEISQSMSIQNRRRKNSNSDEETENLIPKKLKDSSLRKSTLPKRKGDSRSKDKGAYIVEPEQSKGVQLEQSKDVLQEQSKVLQLKQSKVSGQNLVNPSSSSSSKSTEKLKESHSLPINLWPNKPNPTSSNNDSTVPSEAPHPLPMLDAANLEFFMSGFKSILTKLDQQTNDILFAFDKATTGSLTGTKKSASTSFSKEDIVLPIDTIQQLDKLEEKLKDEKYKEELVAFLSRKGGRNYRDITRNVMGSVLTKSLAGQLSMTGRKGGKLKMEEKRIMHVFNSAIRMHDESQKCSDYEIKREMSKFLVMAPHTPGGSKYKSKLEKSMSDSPDAEVDADVDADVEQE